MHGISAAHTTLPLPSYVRVTNLENGRSIVVRVNDRGPYAHSRVIDLSIGTAKALDFYSRGLARVRVEYVGRAPIEGTDDEMLMATLREGSPAPAPSKVMIAAAKPFIPSADDKQALARIGRASVHAQQRIEPPREAGSYQRGGRGRPAEEQTGRPPDLCLGRGDKGRAARAESRSRGRLCAHARQCTRAHERSRGLLSAVWPETRPRGDPGAAVPEMFTSASNTAGGIAFGQAEIAKHGPGQGRSVDLGHAGCGYARLGRVRLVPVMKLRALASWFSTPVAKWGVVAFLAGAIGSADREPNPVSGPKPSDGGYQTSAAHAILIEADSGSVLFEKGADDLIPPASLSKLMTAEVVFNEIKQGRLKPTDEFIVRHQCLAPGRRSIAHIEHVHSDPQQGRRG